MGEFVLSLAAVTLIAAFVFRRGRGKAGSAAGDHENELLMRCFGDEEKAERLITLELARNPKLSRENAARDAVQSIMRDNR